MARQCWAMALPTTDEEGNTLAGNIDYVKIVLDRSDGKPGSNGEKADNGAENIPDRISRLNKERLNAISADVAGEDDDDRAE
ncbi:MAG: hypothetical protein JRE28_10350 [Deltaproteobacteria bacterium]|nr:hypothetical protein [Deltaproteobacteria bacterium]